ncbi:MAG TPA: PAS domain S-box protein [Methanomassiliicoccales archaeon]|nr:PAS domain S-box protein [Methanomassiliicoccales archaeon]
MEVCPHRPRVLYVDDEETYANLAKIYLDELGDCDVEIELFSPRVPDRITREHFDVIVSDYMMPDMDGIELLKCLKKMAIRTPFILFTGKGREEVAIDALNNGAEFYIQKGGSTEAQFAELSNMIIRSVRSSQVEEELFRSEESYRQLVECANVIIMERDLNGKILFMNEFGLDFFGYSERELMGRNVVGTILPKWDSDGKDMAAMILGISENPQAFRVNENENKLRDGTRVWISWVNKALLDDNGNRIGILAVGSEITERKKAERVLVESERKIRDILDASADAFVAVNYDLIITYFNKAAEDLLSVSRESVIGKEFLEAFPWMIKLYNEELVDRVLAEGENVQLEMDLDINGKKHWFEIKVRSTDEMILIYFWSIEDRIKREEALRRSEEKYRKIFETAANLIVSVDSEGSIVDCNSRIEEVLGYTREELIGKNMELTFPPDFREKAKKTLRNIIKEGNSRNSEYKMVRKDGTIIDVGINSSAIYDDEGNFEKTISLIRDITERRLAEYALQKSESTFRSLFEHSALGIMITDGEGILLELNPASTRILGYTLDDAKDLDEVGELVHPDDLKGQIEKFQEMMQGYKDHFVNDLRIRSKDGAYVWVQQTTLVIRNNDGTPEMIMSMFEDINDRKIAEDLLRQSEEKYRTIIDQSADGIVLMDIEGNALKFNSAFRNLTGYSKENLCHFNLDHLLVKIDEENALMQFSEVLRMGNSVRKDVYIRGKDGEIIPVDINTILIDSGDKMLLAGIFRDNRERNRMMEALGAANRKLNLLGSVTRHDLMNQLTTLFGHLEMAKMEIDDEKVLNRIDRALTAAENINYFLEFGRDYERMGTKEPVWISAEDALIQGRSTLEMQEIDVQCKLAGLKIFTDPMLVKVLHNLLDNSIRHGNHVHSIKVFYEPMPSGLKLVYEDDGVGISLKQKSSLFEERLGHGLFLIKDILGITGITIQEVGTPGEGVRFEMFIPEDKYQLVA